MEEDTVFYNNQLKVNYKYHIVNRKSSFVICGYYWGKNNVNKNNKDGLTYGQLADRLIDYCIINGCNYFIAEIPDFAKPGGYQIAINFKPTFILETLPIIYPRKAAVIDTDMTVRRYPSIFDMDYDFMGFNWFYEPHQVFPSLSMNCFDPYVLHTSGGMLVFNNTTPSIKLLREWKEITDKNPGKAEDRMLSVPFNKKLMLNEIRCLWLPVTYFFIPYFYEITDVFDLPKKYRKAFKHIKDFDREYSFSEFFDMKLKRDIFIHHPEQLTSEEQAALQGAASDRIPEEFYIETGRKLKCLDGEQLGLINNVELYCNLKSDKKAFKYNNKLLELYGFSKSVDKKPEIKLKGKFDIIEKRVKKTHNNMLLVILSNCQANIKELDNNVIVVDRKNCNKSYLIYSIMKKYKMNVLFIENAIASQSNINTIMNQINDIPESYDFSCVNSNAHPVYKPQFAKKCNDPRSLFALTTDLLYFANNKWGTNLLKLWNNECSKDKKVEDRYALSNVFNRNMYAIYSRSKWLSPLSFMPSNKIRTSEFSGIPFPNSVVSKFNDKYNLYDYFIQCADRRPLRKVGEVDPYLIHYISGKFR
jgi:hypothetical protein